MELPSAVDWMDAPTERARDGEILSKRRANLEGEDGIAGWFDTESMDSGERVNVFQGLFLAD